MFFLIVTITILILTTIFVPKKLSKVEIYATSLFAVLFATLTDIYLSFKYGLYWYFEQDIVWVWLIILMGGKPPANILFLNFFPYHLKWVKKFEYIFVWAIFLTLFELSAVHIGGILHYDEWNILYSAILYPFLLLTLYLNLIFIRRLFSN